MHWHILPVKVSHKAVVEWWLKWSFVCLCHFLCGCAGWDWTLQRLLPVEGLLSAESLYRSCAWFGLLIYFFSFLLLFFFLFFFWPLLWTPLKSLKAAFRKLWIRPLIRAACMEFQGLFLVLAVTLLQPSRLRKELDFSSSMLQGKWTPLMNWKYTWGKDHNFVTIRGYFNVLKYKFHTLVEQHYFYTRGLWGNMCACMNWTLKNFLCTCLKFGKQHCFTVGLKDSFANKSCTQKKTHQVIFAACRSWWFSKDRSGWLHHAVLAGHHRSEHNYPRVVFSSVSSSGNVSIHVCFHTHCMGERQEVWAERAETFSAVNSTSAIVVSVCHRPTSKSCTSTVRHWQAAAEASHYACCYAISTINRDLEPFALKPSPAPPWNHLQLPSAPCPSEALNLAVWLSAHHAVVLKVKAGAFFLTFFFGTTFGTLGCHSSSSLQSAAVLYLEKWSIRGKKSLYYVEFPSWIWVE